MPYKYDNLIYMHGFNGKKPNKLTYESLFTDDCQTQLSTVNNHDVITRLLFATRPEMTWRSALWRVLREARTEIDVKNAVLFLRYSVRKVKWGVLLRKTFVFDKY